MLRSLLFITALLTCSVILAAEDPDREIHEELRGLLNGIELAINEERYSDLAPFFHKNLRVTTVNQEIISNPNEISDYFNRWFGPGGYLKKLEIRLTPDELTEFYADKRFGIVRGSGKEDYILSDERSYEMLTRWTATVILDDDGQWRILSLHIGTNFLDNPVLNEIENSLMYFAISGIVIGIVLTGLFVLVFRRFRRKPV